MSNSIMPQPLESLTQFRENHKYPHVEAFIEAHPYPFLIIEIGGKLQADTGGFQTLGLAAPNPDGSAPKKGNNTLFIAPISKEPGSPNAFSMITLGRAGNNDIVIRENHISKMHCFFQKSTEGKFYINDPGSTNGTWIAGLRLESHKPFEIKGNMEIQIGKKVSASFHTPKEFYYIVWPSKF